MANILYQHTKHFWLTNHSNNNNKGDRKNVNFHRSVNIDATEQFIGFL